MTIGGGTVLDHLAMGNDPIPGDRIPVEVHCHGFGEVDFSDLDSLDLTALDAACAAEGVVALPTLYLHRERLPAFERLLATYARRRAEGDLQHVAGIALEGPLLASHGGTPAATVWLPTPAEWERLAALGPLGLAYTVMSPDAMSPGAGLADQVGVGDLSMPAVVRLLVEHGVRPALGHFTRDDPTRSAAMVEELIGVAHQAEWRGQGARVVTDHLFNDMPLNIRHAFRSSRARQQRDAIIESYDLASWSLDTVADVAGPVPGEIIRQTAAGRVAACINFDGEHVDLDIARRAVELMGVENSMLMTDRCDSARLGGQPLHHEHENTLWYQDEGVVAAGSQPLARQVRNALEIGLDRAQVWQLVVGAAHRAFGLSPVAAPMLAPTAPLTTCTWR